MEQKVIARDERERNLHCRTVDVELQEVSAGMASWLSGMGSAVGAVLSYGVLWLL